MIAKIKSDGTLQVASENELEIYALNKWWLAFQDDYKGDDKSALQVQCNTTEAFTPKLGFEL